MITRALAAALAASALAHAWQWWQLDYARDELAQVRADQVAAALSYAENARAAESAAAERIAHAQQARETEQAASRRAADRLRLERDGLRNAVESYAAGTDGDSVAACRERAATIGALLDDAMRTAAACAAGAEQHASDVRALRWAWPR